MEDEPPLRACRDNLAAEYLEVNAACSEISDDPNEIQRRTDEVIELCNNNGVPLPGQLHQTLSFGQASRSTTDFLLKYAIAADLVQRLDLYGEGLILR